jgi:hypothetical protein
VKKNFGSGSGIKHPGSATLPYPKTENENQTQISVSIENVTSGLIFDFVRAHVRVPVKCSLIGVNLIVIV